MTALQKAFSIAAPALVLAALCAGAGAAQTWNFHVTAEGPDGAAVPGSTRVVLSGSEVSMLYTVRANGRELPLVSCRARVADVDAVRTVPNGDNSSLFLYLKNGRTAACANGDRQIAIVPIGSDAAARAVAAKISQACCSPQVAAALPRATPAPARAPRPASPSPRPTATVAAGAFVPPADWVQTDGLFSFLRIRNRDARPLVIGDGEILNCRDIASGCGRFSSGRLTIAPGAVATVATVVSNSPHGGSFSFRYDASSGSVRYSGSGVSAKRSGDARSAMSTGELRAAEAVALGQMTAPHGTTTPGPPPYVPPRLTQRGTSRLAIGMHGQAMLRVQVGPNGMAENASIVSVSDRNLIPAAIETAVTSRYAPAMRNGRPTTGDYIATFRFDGSDPDQDDVPAWRRSPLPTAAPSNAASSAAQAPP